MNQTSEQIVLQVLSSLVMPPVALTLTQEEADAIKDRVREWYFDGSVQGAVQGGFVRCELEPKAPKKDIDEFMADGYPSSDSDGNWLCHVCGRRINHLGNCDHHTPKIEATDVPDIMDILNKRMSDYTQWIWDNLDRAATGKSLLPRLEWDKPRMKIFSYADLVNFRRGVKK